MLGCLIERENGIFGSVEGFDEGGNEGVSEVSGIDEVSGGACGNEDDLIGLLLAMFRGPGMR